MRFCGAVRVLVRVLPIVALVVLALVTSETPSLAQLWPASPVSALDGRLLTAGELSATCGGSDPGWFTYTDYDTSAVRRVRAGVTIEVRPASRVAVLVELRAETGSGVRPYAAFVRLTPFASRVLDVQLGRIPPVFGTYARRSYPQDNPLVGDPLAYQYLTTLRPDAIPASADDVLRQRGRGWLVHYPIGNAASASGVPVIAAAHYATGVEARVTAAQFELAASVTSGAIANPQPSSGAGVQVAGHATWRPRPELVIGASIADGVFRDASVHDAAPALPAGHDHQTAGGVDIEVSSGRWLVRGEFIASAFQLPLVNAPLVTESLVARSGYVESKVRLWPGVFAAARVDRLWFSDLAGTSGVLSWDADVTRIEAGAGWMIRRGLLLKASWMGHWRDGGKIQREQLGALQVVAWF